MHKGVLERRSTHASLSIIFARQAQGSPDARDSRGTHRFRRGWAVFLARPRDPLRLAAGLRDDHARARARPRETARSRDALQSQGAHPCHATACVRSENGDIISVDVARVKSEMVVCFADVEAQRSWRVLGTLCPPSDRTRLFLPLSPLRRKSL